MQIQTLMSGRLCDNADPKAAEQQTQSSSAPSNFPDLSLPTLHADHRFLNCT
jgi:hypothetical protein